LCRGTEKRSSEKERERERDWRSDFFYVKLKSEWKISIPSMDEQLNLSWIGVVSISLGHTTVSLSLTRSDSCKRFFSANPRFVNFSPFPLILNFSVLNLSLSDRWRNGKSLSLSFPFALSWWRCECCLLFCFISQLSVCGFCWSNARGLFLFAEFRGFFFFQLKRW